jgi:hypothetical protein
VKSRRELEIELKAALELVERLREDNKKLFAGWVNYDRDHSPSADAKGGMPNARGFAVDSGSRSGGR